MVKVYIVITTIIYLMGFLEFTKVGMKNDFPKREVTNVTSKYNLLRTIFAAILFAFGVIAFLKAGKI